MRCCTGNVHGHGRRLWGKHVARQGLDEAGKGGGERGAGNPIDTLTNVSPCVRREVPRDSIGLVDITTPVKSKGCTGGKRGDRMPSATTPTTTPSSKSSRKRAR